MANRTKPILVVKFPYYYSMQMVEESKKALYSMEGLKDDYHIIVASTEQKELTFESSHPDEQMKVTFKEFKKFKTIIENEENLRTNGESSEPEQ